MDKITIKNKKSMSVFILIPNIEGKSVLCYSKLQLEHCLGETLKYKMTKCDKDGKKHEFKFKSTKNLKNVIVILNLKLSLYNHC